MKLRSVGMFLSKVGATIWNWFAPKTSLGRIRRNMTGILVLLVFFGSISYPNTWNAAASGLNQTFKKVPILSKIKVPSFWVVPFRLGLDLQGGTHLVYRADVKNIPASEQSNALSGVRDVIERRVNSFGVSEPLVQTNKAGSNWQVIVDLAGVKNVADAIGQIGQTPTLEFKEQGSEPKRTLTADEQKDLVATNTAANKKGQEALKKALLPTADFKSLAKEYTTSPGVITANYDTGFVPASNSTDPNSTFASLAASGKIKVGAVYRNIVFLGDSNNIVKLEETKSSGLEYNSSHILVCYKGASNCSNNRSKAEAQTLIKKIKQDSTPANFAAQAKKYSEDPGSGPSGGALGWARPLQMVPEFEKAALALKKGIISEPVESSFGFHLILKNDERPFMTYRFSRLAIKIKTEADYLPADTGWKNTALSGKQLKKAVLQFDQRSSEPQVSLQFDSEGAQLFADITDRNVGKPVAIFLDGRPISVPTVQQKITGGTAVITGRFSVEEGKLLAGRLNAGALPVPITLESQQTIGASLGQDSLSSSLKAGLVGFLVVAVFMLLYYRLPGLVAILALLMYSALNLAAYKLIPVTLSLSGIAGFILSVGMAVDANVLIFERMKEELLAGKPLSLALDEGFKRAWTSIRDSNFTTLISCVILFYTSTSLIKGFALTLGLGVLISMFSAITVSKTLLRLVMSFKALAKDWLFLPGLNRGVKREEK